MDEALVSVFALFFDETPATMHTIESGLGETDFRMTVLVETEAGDKYVLKLADNDFTFPEKIAVWQRTVEEYRKLGYYCPRIFPDKTGSFPIVAYGGHNCTVYAEEFARYRPALERDVDDDNREEALYNRYRRDLWEMTAKIAAQYFDYTAYPSAYCLFETFCPSDRMDEVLENALAWKEYADKLPDAFRAQTDRIFRLWTENRAALEPLYRKLPHSVFQADLNFTNVLLDDADNFVGIMDFNLCGREVFLNYLMRENSGVSTICDALDAASAFYRFSEPEKDIALMLYRCLKPLWFTRREALKKAGNDLEAIRACLDRTERELTEPYDFRSAMEPPASV